MRIQDIADRNGIIIETLGSHVAGTLPTGNVYKVVGWNATKSKVVAWKQYRQGKVELHPTVPCRILDNKPYSGNYGPF